MNMDDKVKTYYIILGSFIVIILILTLALGFSLFSTNSNIVKTNLLVTENAGQIKEFEKNQASNFATTRSSFSDINQTLGSMNQDLNALKTCCGTVRNTTNRILQDVSTIPRPPPIDILNQKIPEAMDILNRPIAVEKETLNTFDNEILAAPVDYSKMNFLYVLRATHCKNKKSLSGIKLERIHIPELSNLLIQSFVPHHNGFLVSTQNKDSNMLHYIIPGSYNNRYTVRWSENMDQSMDDMLSLSNGHDTLYYGISNGKLYAMQIHENRPIQKLELQHVPLENEIINITNSPDRSLMSVTDTTGQSTIYKLTSQNGVQKVTDLPYATSSISDAKNGSFDIIANVDGQLQIVGSNRIPLTDFSSAAYINNNNNVFGLNSNHLRCIDHFKIHKDDIYFVSKSSHGNNDIVL